MEKGSPFLRTLFDDKKCVRVITSHPSKIADLEKAFESAQNVKIDQIQVAAPEFKNVKVDENDLEESDDSMHEEENK